MNLLKLIMLMGLFLSGVAKADEDEIIEITAQDIVGTEELPVIHIELTVKKSRDLHVALQDLSTQRPVKTTMKRIKKSGKYHFEFKTNGVKPGKYRFNAYLTPRKKNWNDRIGQTESHDIEIIDAVKYVKKVKFGNKDRIKSVKWPKKIIDNKEHQLLVKFDITEPRDLHIKLLSSGNWEEFGALKYTINKPQDFTMPFDNLINSFEEGKYAWVVYLTDVGGEDSILPKKFGKHFEILKPIIK